MERSISDLIGELIEAGRVAVDKGLALASGGNLSARLGGDDRFIVTGSGTWLNRLTPESFSIMSLEGAVQSGAATPSSEWKLHSRSYRARDDVNAVIHLHPQYSILLDALGYEIRLLTLDHAYYVRSIGKTAYYPNGSDELADTAAEQALSHNCVLMAHHGCSTLGPDVSMALRRALNLEEAATQTYRALVLGDSNTTFPEDAMKDLLHG
jgi:L-fuculose-phosphate aldolase